ALGIAGDRVAPVEDTAGIERPHHRLVGIELQRLAPQLVPGMARERLFAAVDGTGAVARSAATELSDAARARVEARCHLTSPSPRQLVGASVGPLEPATLAAERARCASAEPSAGIVELAAGDRHALPGARR